MVLNTHSTHGGGGMGCEISHQGQQEGRLWWWKGGNAPGGFCGALCLDGVSRSVFLAGMF